jgi:hypothetical protein
MQQCEDKLLYIKKMHDEVDRAITNSKPYFNLNAKQKYDLLYILKQILRES